MDLSIYDWKVVLLGSVIMSLPAISVTVVITRPQGQTIVTGIGNSLPILHYSYINLQSKSIQQLLLSIQFH